MENNFDENALKQIVKKLDEYLWNITKNVVCTICHEFFNEPVTTTCGHSFCLSCFRKLLYRVSSSKNTCPLCRHPIKRREANNNHILSKIAKMCYEFPVAFRADVVNLNPALRGLAEELVNNSRILEILYERSGRNNKNYKTKAVVHEDTNFNDSGSSISGIASIKMTNETNNLEDNQDLKSVSQLKSKSQVYKSDLSEIEKKLKRLGEIPAKQKVDNWLHDVKRDSALSNFGNSVSVNVENAESSEDDKCGNAEENMNEYHMKSFMNEKENASSNSSFVRIDYDKSKKANAGDNEKISAVNKNEILNESNNDPYEFIASQKNGCKSKKKIKKAKKKILPTFESIQNFTKDGVKKTSLISDLDESKSYPDKNDNTSGSKKMKIESATGSNNASRKFSERWKKIEEIPKSVQKNFTEKIGNNLFENSNKNSLDDKDYDSDGLCSTVKRSRLDKVPSLMTIMGKNKSTRVRPRKMVVVSDSSSVNSIDFDESPVFNNKTTRPATVSESHENPSDKNDSKLKDFLAIENAEVNSLESDDNEIIRSNDSLVSANNGNYCVSPGWSRVSNLKAYFKVSNEQKRQARKSLNISGGEPNLNVSKHKTVGQLSEENDGDMDYFFNNANNNNGNNLYIEDLSQNPELLLGFDTPDSADEEKDFKKTVQGMEKELEMVLKTPLFHKNGNAAINENENNMIRSLLIQNNEKEIVSTFFPENQELNESSPVNVLDSAKHDENNIVNNVSALQVKAQDEKQCSVACSSNTIDSAVLVKSTNCKIIPFALLGKIKKKKKSSIVFLQLGRLSPHLKRSRSTVVKIVFPKVLHGGNRKGFRTSSTTVGVQTNLPFLKENANLTDLGKDSQLINMAYKIPDAMTPIPLVSAAVQREKVEAQIQTSQSFLQSSAKEVQTSQKLEFVNACVQTFGNDNENEMIFSGDRDVSMIPSQIFQDFYSSNVYKKRVSIQCTNPTANSDNIEKNKTCSTNSKIANELSQNENLIDGLVRNGENEIVESEIMDVDFDTDVQHELNKTWVTGSQTEEKETKFSRADVEILNHQKDNIASPQRKTTGQGEKCVTQSAAILSNASVLVGHSKGQDEEKGNDLVAFDDNSVCKNVQLTKTRSRLSPKKITEENANAQPGEESDSDIFIEQTPPRFSCTIARDFDAASPIRNGESKANICEKSAMGGESSGDLKENPVMKFNSEESFLLLSECQIDSQREKEDPVSDMKFFMKHESAIDKDVVSGSKSTENMHSESESVSKQAVVVAKEGENRRENDENNQNQLNFDVKCNDGTIATDKEEGKNLSRRGLKLSSCKNICIVSSCVSNRENIEKFVNRFKIEHSVNPMKEMTHLIVGLHKNDDDELVPFCTPKLLYALANKKWIVTEEWVETCLMFNSIVTEEWFESLDPTGGNACTAARLSTGYLLEKCEVCLLGEFKRITREEFSGLIRDCGGTVLRQPTDFSFSPDKIRMILANGPELQGDPHIETIMKKYRTAVMSRDVIIVSIQNYKIVNFSPFLLGSATVEELVDWGYSYDLVKNDGEGLSDNEKDYGDESESDDGMLH